MKRLEIIKEQGLGRYWKSAENILGEKGGYFSYVSLGLIDEKKYCVIFANPYVNFNQYLYGGYDKNKAENLFNEIIERDKKFKENLINETFSKN